MNTVGKTKSNAMTIALLIILNLLFIVASISGAELNQRDRLLLDKSSAIIQHIPQTTPEAFCRLIFAELVTQPNCAQRHFEPGREIPTNQLKIAREEVEALSLAYKAMADTLAVQTSAEAMPLVNVASQRAEFLKTLSIRPPADVGYFGYFNALLIGQGISYNPFSNTFKPLPNDLGRYLLNSGTVSRELQILCFINRMGLLILGAVASLLIVVLIRSGLNSTGGAITVGIFLFWLLGLIVSRDASINFGNYSSYFAINALRNIFSRQLLITTMCLIVFTCSAWLVLKQTTPEFFRLSNSSFKWIALLTPAAAMNAYALGGIPIGAEFLKISACFLCALLITRYGRILELTQNHIGLYKVLRSTQPVLDRATDSRRFDTLSASGEYQGFILKKIVLMPAGLVLAFFGSSLFFSDLGGTLVAGMVTFFSIFVLLGAKFAWIASIPCSIATALLFSFSDKVRGRLDLMQDPMRAHISDFARLDEFVSASDPDGFGLNHIKWCSNDGVCLPLQSLSDYMPTIIAGALGKELSLLLLGLSFALLLGLCIKCFLLSWDYRSNKRLVAMTASLLCLAGSLQALITVLGNWRVIPLTGLGYPLLSIGFSSSLSASLGLGLAVGIVFKKL